MHINVQKCNLCSICYLDMHANLWQNCLAGIHLLDSFGRCIYTSRVRRSLHWCMGGIGASFFRVWALRKLLAHICSQLSTDQPRIHSESVNSRPTHQITYPEGNVKHVEAISPTQQACLFVRMRCSQRERSPSGVRSFHYNDFVFTTYKKADVR